MPHVESADTVHTTLRFAASLLPRLSSKRSPNSSAALDDKIAVNDRIGDI